jgi:hypothetical protein
MRSIYKTYCTVLFFAKEIALLAFFSGVISFTNFFAQNGQLFLIFPKNHPCKQVAKSVY